MTQAIYLWNPPPVHSLPVRGIDARYQVNRIFCVGRNYHAHAVEMGVPVDKATVRPFYFTKAASMLVESGAPCPTRPAPRTTTRRWNSSSRSARRVFASPKRTRRT